MFSWDRAFRMTFRRWMGLALAGGRLGVGVGSQFFFGERSRVSQMGIQDEHQRGTFLNDADPGVVVPVNAALVVLWDYENQRSSSRLSVGRSGKSSPTNSPGQNSSSFLPSVGGSDAGLVHSFVGETRIVLCVRLANRSSGREWQLLDGLVRRGSGFVFARPGLLQGHGRGTLRAA